MRISFRTIAILLLAGVALLRGAMPAGYMLAAAQTPDGRFLTVQMCDAHQQSILTINLDTGETTTLADLENRKRQSNAQSHAPCVFATASFLSVTGIIEFTPHLRVQAFEGPANLAAVFIRAPAFSLPHATGPPLTI